MSQKKKQQKESRPSPARLRRELIQIHRNRAMVEIKRLVKKYGRPHVQYCLNQLKELAKKRDRLAQIKREADQLEREIG